MAISGNFVQVLLLSFLSVLLCSWLGGRLLGYGEAGSELDKVIEELRTKITKSQITKHKLGIYKKQIGVYPSSIKMNFCCSREMALLRDAISIFDNNAFVTLWISIIQLEAARFNDGPLPSDEQLLNALTAVNTYHDKNRASEDGILVFWPQTYNKTAGMWFCRPDNFGRLETLADDILIDFHKIFKDLGLEGIWNITLGRLQLFLERDGRSLGIPPDFDDTFVNLGLGALLSSHASRNHQSSALFQGWTKENTNFVQSIAALKKYAYRPDSDTLDNGMLDPRTFFYIREYLYQMEAENKKGAFVVTWALNLSESIETFDNCAMPFNSNNIDLTVSSNVIYGLTSAVLAGLGDPNKWFDADTQMIYENTTDLVAWEIERNLSSRPDLALTYYPSVMNFYWFTARTLNLIQNYAASHDGILPFPVLGTVKDRLLDVLQNTVTPTVVKMAQSSDKHNDTVYFDDFLGINDRNLFGKPENSAQDRIFSTAMAVNILLYTWMTNDTLLPHTPATVKGIVDKASQWLIKNTLSGKYKPWNAIFSGSIKNLTDLPFWYPANIFQFINGSDIPPNKRTMQDARNEGASMIIGVKGIIPESQYEEMLKQEHFNMTTPINFNSYNIDSGFDIKKIFPWPFWCSEPWTYASAMLALTQYRALKASGQL